MEGVKTLIMIVTVIPTVMVMVLVLVPYSLMKTEVMLLFSLPSFQVDTNFQGGSKCDG